MEWDNAFVGVEKTGKSRQGPAGKLLFPAVSARHD